MKQIVFYFLIAFTVCSCNKSPKEIEEPKAINLTLDPQVKVDELTSEFIDWWSYHNKNIELHADFVGYNEDSELVEKSAFLESLVTGKYIPLRLQADDGKERYKLYALGSLIPKGAVSAIKYDASTNLNFFNMEGQQIPDFEFTAINGNTYTNQSIKGKMTVLKTWFISCVACVEEFPELNEFVEEHKKANDINFISLAIDKKVPLEKFLKKKPFNYEVVPEQRAFIEDELNLYAYPTHVVINENGTVVKVVNKADQMITFLKNRKS